MELHSLTLSRKVRTPAEQSQWIGGAVARWLADNNGSLVATGSSNAFAVTTEQAFTEYFDGLTLTFEANHSITGAATLDVNSIGPVALRKDGTAALVSGDIVSGQRVQVTHDGTNFQVMSRTVQEPVTDGTDTLTTRGDLLTRDASDLARLAVGAADSFVGSDGTDPAWVAGASQAEQEAGTETGKPVTPSVQHHHPSAAKFWVKCDAAGNILASYNVTSVTFIATGLIDITIATDFSSAHWACMVSLEQGASTNVVGTVDRGNQTAGVVRVESRNGSDATRADPDSYYVAGFGDQ